MAWYNIFGNRPPIRKELTEEQKARLQKSIEGADVFGPKPQDPTARLRWDQYVFDRLDQPIYLSVPVAARALYGSREIGLPIFWQDQEGDQFAAFPEAEFYQPQEIPAYNALHSAGRVYANYQIRCIDDFGGYFAKLHEGVLIVAGGEYSRKNDENRKKAEAREGQA